ncbi:hypothetical protein [Paraclostridium sordellii]|uniref:hypothetical protein n=1 Tax=Paraclostridium sordellii TaxID=1505 RepID=UPI001C614AE6|nr:hypothetical protein [Paeniclostridium sordellii]QYE99109.1 hypothetical protein KZ987_06255 [Paeniclostridium sordellii]
MANILLIEPDYKCKYPPLGLMKIAYYHKEIRKDTVWFSKGKLPKKISESVRKEMKNNKYYIDRYGEKLDEHIDEINHIIENNLWDRVNVSTLFTFEYEKTIEAIDYAKELVGKENVYTGGILATLMPDKLRADTGVTVNTHQLTSSKMIGYDDDVNIDILTPDYSILCNTEYEYENEDAYYAYTTRGCGMNCGFCAVKTLEPVFEPFISIKNQINKVKELYGEKKDLLLMDNNVLKSKHLDMIVDEIKELGFEKGATYKNPRTGKIRQRFVDFNQGLDAFLMTEPKAKLLGQIATKPARIAFDHIEDEEVYVKAITLAATNGVNNLSNYLLYNAEAFGGKGRQYKADGPEDLYRRLEINVELQEELNKNRSQDDERVHIFSFPMRYIPLDDKTRGYVGPKWTKKQLRAVQTILIPTQGKGVSSKSFFEAAFGKTKESFIETIQMPESYIASRGEPAKVRNATEEEMQNKISNFRKYESLRFEWKNLYSSFTDEEKSKFDNVIADNKFDYYNFNRLKTEQTKKLFIHYQTSPGILQLLEDLYMNENHKDIALIKEYLTSEGNLIYKEILEYIKETSKSNRRVDIYRTIFGDKTSSELIKLWIDSKCKSNEFIGLISRVYSIKEACLYIVKWIVQFDVLNKTEYDYLIKIVSECRLEKELDFLDRMLARVYDLVKEQLDDEVAITVIDEIKEDTTIQLTLF